MLLYLFALVATLLSSLAVGSLVGQLSDAPFWPLVGAVIVCLVAPLALALWLRHLSGEQRRAPRAVVVLGLLNLLGLVILVGLAGPTTHRALVSRGTWWLDLLPGESAPRRKTVLRRQAETAIAWVAAAIPHDNAADSRAAPLGSGGSHQPQFPDLPAPSPPDTAEAADGPLHAARATQPDSGLATAPRPEAEGDAEQAPSDTTTVAFERHGSAIVVPVQLRGPRLSRNVRMLFDTGATFSTIDGRTLADLGLYVTAGDPTIDLRTANGVARRTITVIEGARIGRADVAGGLTVALCDACAESNIVGLLGLNYARHFRVTVDHAEGTLQLQPKHPAPSRLYDIRPFVRLSDIHGQQRGDRLKIDLWLENAAPRPLRNVTLVARATTSAAVQISGQVTAVAPGRRHVRFEGRVPNEADGFRVELADASW